jgi:pilus assembly protein CpaC
VAPGTANFTPIPVELVRGKSIILDCPGPSARISLSNPEAVDIRLLSPWRIYLTGKAPGTATVTAWANDDVISALYDVTVVPDLTQLKSALHQIMPAERSIRVVPAGEAVTLSGTVSSAANLSRAVTLAETFAPKRVVNMLSVGGVHQVMLEVKVAEMSRSVLRQLGVNFSYFMDGDFIYQFLNNMVYLDNENGPLPISPSQSSAGNLAVTDSVNSMFRFSVGKAAITGFLDALKQDGLIKILAEPTLICISGKSASFLAGGEIPVPIPQGLGQTAIEYKQFGVSLNFTPRVIGPRRISMEVAPEVSELDYNNAVNINNFLIPALNTRRAATTVELEDGQSFAIAGLLKDNVREVADKIPGLGEVPVLGTLFRSTSFQKNESELIIIVTPRLARPLDVARQTLPTDSYVEPDDTELYFLGLTEGRNKPVAAPAAHTVPLAPEGGEHGLEGSFGHILPRQ